MNYTYSKYLSAFTAILLLISLYSNIMIYQLPISRNIEVLDATYTQKADFNATAYVKPSLLYDNKTEIMGNGTIYLNLLEAIDIFFDYHFTGSPESSEIHNLNIEYECVESLKGLDWKKVVCISKDNIINQAISDHYQIKIEDIEEIIETFEDEIGLKIYQYNYEIEYLIKINFIVNEKHVEDTINPKISICFEGGKATSESLTYNKTIRVTHLSKVDNRRNLAGLQPRVEDLRGLSIIFLLITIAAFIVSLSNLNLKREARSTYEKLGEEVGGKIVDISKSINEEKYEVITLNDLKDLAVISEESFKPILKLDEVFYIVDQNILYKHENKEE